MFANLFIAIVDCSRRFAVAITLGALLIAAIAGWYAATHFQVNTDINQILADNIPFRQHEREMDQAFPQKTGILLIVVDGQTPEVADHAAAALTEILKQRSDLFMLVEQPDVLPFFRQNGLLFLSKQELGDRLDQLTQAQPLLGAVTADPSLRGLFDTIGLMAQGIQYSQVDYATVERPMSAIADTIDAALKNQDKPLSVQGLMGGSAPDPRELRKLIVTRPKVDYNELEPGKAATEAVRDAAQQLQLTQANGVTVRLTGEVALNDEEFASVANGTGIATALSGALVFILLLLALRSPRLVLPILLVLIVGLVLTTALALLVVKSLNLISVAFAVMFIGIAVDLGLQFGVRYRDQHYREPDHAKAMVRTAAIIAVPISMAAASTSLGFFAFIPTDYRGVSELGLIAGMGMLIAFILNITLLPALLTLTKPPAEGEAIGLKQLVPADAFLNRYRRVILIALIPVVLIALALASQLRFDFDPLDMKDAHTESVATLLDLMKDPDFGAYTIDILRPDLPAAQALADQLAALPQVDHVMTLNSFVPDDQPAKLAMIADTKTLLDTTLNLPAVAAPTNDDLYNSMNKLSAALHAVAAGHAAAGRLADLLDQLQQKRDDSLLQKLQQLLVKPILGEIAMTKTVLAAKPVAITDIPNELKRDWVTADGRYLVETYPKGNPRDHKILLAFSEAVRRIAPDAGGTPISIEESGKVVKQAFIHAGCYALIAISLLCLLILRSLRDTILLLLPLLLAALLTLATMVLIGLSLNYANIIALPLLLSLGVSYAIYFVSGWRAGLAQPLQSSMARAVLFSAATVLVAFSSLAVSSHPGTRGMGELLTLALLYSLISTFFILPVLLGPPKTDKS